MKMTLLRLFQKEQKNLQFPSQGDPIEAADIPPGSVLLFLRRDGNRLTQMGGNRLYKYQFIPDFHAALVLDDGRVLQVGLVTKIVEIADLYTSTTRIDAIKYPGLTSEQVQIVLKEAYKWTGHFYDWEGYAHFLTRYIVGLGRVIRESDKAIFCSEGAALCHENAGHRISFLKPGETAPWDLRVWASTVGPDRAQVYTHFIGADFAA